MNFQKNSEEEIKNHQGDKLPRFITAILLSIGGMVLGIIFSLVFVYFILEDVSVENANKIGLLVGEIFIPVPIIIWAAKRKINFMYLFRIKITGIKGRFIVYTIILGIGLSIITDELDRIIQKIFPASAKLSYIEQFMKIDSFATAAYLIILALILAPLIEEMIFRGFLLKVFERSFRDITKAVLFNALLFAIFHFNPWWFVQIFVIGIFMGYLAWKMDSIALSFFLHFCINAMSLLYINAGSKIISIYEVNDHVSPVFLVIGLLLTYIGIRSINSKIPYIERD